MHKTLPLFLLIAGLLLGHSGLSFALPEDRNKIAQLRAETADLNQKTHQGEYRGKVRFDQGSTHLRAIRALTQGNDKNELSYAVAFGSPEKPAHYWEKIAADKPYLHAYAQEIHYYPDKHLIELIGDARVVQGEDSFSAPLIRYNTLKQSVIAKGQAQKPILIIMHPKEKHE